MIPKNGSVYDITKWMRSLAESLGRKRRVNIPTITVRGWYELCQALDEASRHDNKAARDAIYREAKKKANEAVAVNVSALRDAVAALVEYWDWNGYDAMLESRLKDEVRAAMTAPPRNCDVGMEEEQHDRFHDFCRISNRSCPDCPVYLKLSIGQRVSGSREDCILRWEQLPYVAAQEGGQP